MKDLTTKELEKAPAKIQFLYSCAMTNQPVGMSLYEEILKEYPEYFPDEVEHRRKWSAIPQEVHDAYHEEYWKLREDAYKDIPHRGKGMIFFINNPKEDAEYSMGMDIAHTKLQPLLKKLHKKFYAQYDIEWKGI